ncbi:MAG TPA: carboxypeptidase, partial [Opitutae bacterium]|nr:carboxypeptidase [Opitutae bacterium]
DNPYDYWIDQFDPGLDTQTVDRLFAELQEELVPLVRQVLESPQKTSSKIFKGFPVDTQRTFLKQVIEKIGFDFSRSRIDVALHPFCIGNPSECRITTRFHEDHPLDSLFSSIHEAGHGLYELGLPAEHEGTPLAQAVGSAVHESQSRLWENQVGRSRGFWKYWEPKYREAFKDELKDIDPETLYRAINAVDLNPIRVDSDELTYNLHIILRFTLEKQLFAGELDVNDLPEAWNSLTESLLGFTPPSDAQGCMQDIHWAWSCFGYFPSYCMGNMMAAQLWETANKALPHLEDDFAQGDFSAMLGWLRQNIHSQGKRYRTLELVEHVTGESLSPKALIRYLKERYLPLYN